MDTSLENNGQKKIELEDIQELMNIMSRIWQKNHILINAFSDFESKSGVSSLFDKSVQKMALELFSTPSKLIDAQMNFWQDYCKIVENSALQFMGKPYQQIESPDKTDKRFRDDEWNSNALFNFIKQSYLLTVKSVQNCMENVDGFDEKKLQQAKFHTQQFLNAISPNNFIISNPELIRHTIKTKGKNLIIGLQNLLKDLEEGAGYFQVKMTKKENFSIGDNIASTPGKVIFQNDLMQLIQYFPTTPTVHKRPLLFIPPWINKYYILDLNNDKSMVKWMIDKGYTVFMISWVNPDKTYADNGFEDYLFKGPIAALDKIKETIGEQQVNVIGYCVGGTLLACTMAYLEAKKEDRIASATYMTSLIDFSIPGEVGSYIDKNLVETYKKDMEAKGYMDGRDVAQCFSQLRSNDLIWSYVINNYLKGNDPMPFDLLYWNSDSTNLPKKMHNFYLKNMYLENNFCKPGGISINDVPINVSEIKTPSYFISTKEDHIVLWKGAYKGAKLLSGPVRFVLGGSGHIAGIVNPPSKNKYCYWTNEKLPNTANEWFEDSKQHQGSWWNDWYDWNMPYHGESVEPRIIEKGKLPIIENTPGSYVKKTINKNSA